MRDDQIRAGVSHPLGLGRIEHVRRRQQVHLARESNDVDLELITHPRLFKRLAHVAVEETDRREVLNPDEAERAQFLEEQLRDDERDLCR